MPSDPQALVVEGLRCEGFASPAVTDIEQPRLGWTLRSDRSGARQTAYQIQAATRQDALDQPDLWDSGRVESDQQIEVVYEGQSLQPFTTVYWRVQVWDENGQSLGWSETAQWKTALRGGSWSGDWIGTGEPTPATPEAFYEERPNPLLRKGFAVRGGLKSAWAHVCGLGYHELRLNGQKVGDHVLDPAWTQYGKRAFYSSYDVTASLQEGDNALGIMLGNGWWNPLPMTLFSSFNLREALTLGEPCAILELRLEYADGSVETVSTDETWRVGKGPILRNNIYLGEVYDARQEQPGWDASGFDDANWQPATRTPNTEHPTTLQSQPLPPIKVRESRAAQSVTEQAPGTYVVDFGQNLAGFATLRIQAPAGTQVTARFGELLEPDGSLNVQTSCACQIRKGVCQGGPGAPETADQRDVYICKGEGVEEYTPRFTWHGFRYMEITGLPHAPKAEDFTAHWLNSAVERVGEFESSDPLLKDIEHLSMAALFSNMFSVQSDCPHRERLGYGADIAATTEFAMMNLDMAQFYTKGTQDFADDQNAEGGMPETAPYMGIEVLGFGNGSGPVGWGIAHAVLQRDLFRYYGAERVVREQWDATRRYTEFLRAQAPECVIETCISDHESVAPLPRSLTATAHHWYQADTTAWAAEILGKDEDARAYRAWADQIRDAFNARFLDRETGQYDTGTQACQAFALYFGLVPEELEEKAYGLLLKDIEKCDGHLSTGIYGTKYMLDVLSQRGDAELAYRIVTAKGYPGYAYMLEHGATTLWESWKNEQHGSSHNHPMFGSVVEWFFKHLAGLAPAEDAIGFDQAVVCPNFVSGLSFARARHRSVRGEYAVGWTRDGERVRVEVQIPTNTQALVWLPGQDAWTEMEAGRQTFETTVGWPL